MGDKNKKSSNTVWHVHRITRKEREKLNGHRGLLLWFTGLSGSGKSTLASAVEERLYSQDLRTFVLDGDNVRHGLCSDLGFSDVDRRENIRRIGEVAKLLVESGSIVMAAFISPFRSDRQRVRNLLPPGDFLEIHCKCSLEKCEERDVKGLYKKARAGEIKDFTGISSPFEEPTDPELVLETDTYDVNACVEQTLALVKKRMSL
ncbi:MAG: adenylyl-sulfate kinase [Magnetococcales bacterium]|nr:adenylyl-sulfate kinase [Magnetococcales bacterium]